MTTAREEGEGSASRPGRSLPPRKTRYLLYRRLGGPQGRSGQVRKISPPPGFDPRTFQSVASRYTDWATRPTYFRIAWGINFELHHPIANRFFLFQLKEHVLNTYIYHQLPPTYFGCLLHHLQAEHCVTCSWTIFCKVSIKCQIYHVFFLNLQFPYHV